MSLSPSTLELLRRVAATHWPRTTGKLAQAIRAWQFAGCPNLSDYHEPQQEADTMADTTTTTPTPTPTDEQITGVRDRDRKARQNWNKRDAILTRVETMRIDALRVVAARQALALMEIENRLWSQQTAILDRYGPQEEPAVISPMDHRRSTDRADIVADAVADAYEQIVQVRRLIPDPLDLGLATFGEIRRDHRWGISAPGADFDPDATDARFDLLFTADNNHTRRTVRAGTIECVISTTLDGWRLECHDGSDPGGYSLQDRMELTYNTTDTARAQVEWVQFVERNAPNVLESDLSLPPSVVSGRDWMALRMGADLMPHNWKRRVDRTRGGTGKPLDRDRILRDWLQKHPVHELARVLGALTARYDSNADETGRGLFETDGEARLSLAVADELDSRLRPFTLRFYTFDEWDADDDETRHTTYHEANTEAFDWMQDPNAIGRQVIRKLVITGPTPAGYRRTPHVAGELMNPRYRADLVDQEDDDGGAASEAKWIAGSAFGNQGLADLGGLDLEGGDE